MKRNILLIIILLSVFIFSACSGSEEVIEEVNSENITSSQENEQDTLEEVETEELNENDILQEDRDYIINLVKTTINNSDEMYFTQNIKVPFTSKERGEILDILNLDEKEVVKADNGFGVFGMQIYSTSGTYSMLITSLSETEYVIIVDSMHRVILDKETFNEVSQYLLDLTETSIQDGTSSLNEDVYALVNEIVVKDIENIYSITGDDVMMLSLEEIERIKTALNISSWSVYSGDYQGLNEYKKDSITFANKKQEYGGFEYYASLNISNNNETYIATCHFHEGLGGITYISVPKQVYENTLLVYNEIKNQYINQ